MLSQNLDNVRLVVKTTIINELTTVRNPNNMVLLGIAFNHSPEVSSKVGCVFLFNPLYLLSRKIDNGHIIYATCCRIKQVYYFLEIVFQTLWSSVFFVCMLGYLSVFIIH